MTSGNKLEKFRFFKEHEELAQDPFFQQLWYDLHAPYTDWYRFTIDTPEKKLMETGFIGLNSLRFIREYLNNFYPQISENEQKSIHDTIRNKSLQNYLNNPELIIKLDEHEGQYYFLTRKNGNVEAYLYDSNVSEGCIETKTTVKRVLNGEF